jgi:DNA-binding beta-propeller fold protein YncE
MRMIVVAVACCALTACESPVPFYPPGEGSPGDPVIGLGGPAPYTGGVRDDRASRTRGGMAPAAAPGNDVYAAAGAGAGAGMLKPLVARLPPRLYVPNAATGTADVIDARTGRLADRVTEPGSERVVASWSLNWLWIVGPDGLLPVSARTGRQGRARPVSGVRGLYFTPRGREAVTIGDGRIGFRDPVTMRAHGLLPLPCSATGDADFSADETFMVVACARPGRLLRVDHARRLITGSLRLPTGSAPRDVRLSPDGAAFFVADPRKGGLWLVDATRLRVLGFVRTSPGVHGLVPSRDARLLYVLGHGSVTAVDVAARRVTARWRLPRGASPKPGGVSADGTALWLAAPAAGTVFALSTRTGHVQHEFKVGGRPVSVSVYPQPGRYSLGGTSHFR